MSLRERIQVVQKDITTMNTDAIVNAANSSLLGGGGVDGAIHRTAGPGLLAECRALNGCPTGQAKITQGYRLPSKHVIHTVGPIWKGGKKGEREALANCYRNSLFLAQEYNLETIAFPSISTGVYRFPIEEAAKIAVTEVTNFLQQDIKVKQVYHVCFSEQDYQIYQSTLEAFFDAE